MIIDAHHHLWAPQTPELDIGYVWIKDIGAPKPFGDPTPIQRDYLLPEFLGEAGTLTASVHVQADPKVPDPVAETAFIQKISDDSGHPIMIVGFADLTSDTCADTVQRHKAYPNMRGIRQIISYLPDRPEISFAPRNYLDDQTWLDNLAALASEGLSFDLQLYPQQMQQAADLLSDMPDLPVVIDHLGSPYDSSAAGLKTWGDGMARLAELPNVHAKLSGYAMFFGADLGDVPSRVTAEILRLFGPSRCMFGSNFPVDKLHLTHGGVRAFVEGHAGGDKAAVMSDTAASFYRIPVA